MKYNTTFVTAYYNLENTPYYEQHADKWDPAPIFELARSGIYLCIYIDVNCKHESSLLELERECPNFKIMPYRISFRDLWVSRLLGKYAPEDIQLPQGRNEDKDTLEYITYMHSRFELIEDAVSENPWDTAHFAWIDFNAIQLFGGDKSAGFLSLKDIAQYPFAKNGSHMYVPGCWPKLGEDSVRGVASFIYWRFCGSFFIGNANAIMQFAELYRHHLPLFLDEHRILTWEINFWAWMEWRGVWTPTWYRGDHNDSLVALLPNISADTYAIRLSSSVTASSQTYAYPDILSFWPGSASYLEFGGKHYLNTRFVNYWMYPNGYYRFYDEDMVIGNRNYLSELDAETMMPLYYEEMGSDGKLYSRTREPMEKPEPKKRLVSEGLEDIRLYRGISAENPRFIATNVDYSENGRNRMIVGTYNLTTREYEDCICVVPPDPNSWCEKNWVPIMYEGEEHFIYKWSPMEIGKIEDGRLTIVARRSPCSWIFEKLRGSTVFVDIPCEMLPSDIPEGGEYIVGLTHFSEEHTPRHYYHVLVLLEKNTLQPVKCSRVFYFQELGIEFCIGMRVIGEERKYQFWISRFDRDPVCITVTDENLWTP